MLLALSPICQAASHRDLNSPKNRQCAQWERKQTQRASDDRLLILSEGSKTEPGILLMLPVDSLLGLSTSRDSA
jgi:hypothetical protein